ncbi:glucosamine-6-phosphate deaminase [Clostridium cochlearium]|uniref:Glucosamine-6-phosphate deaminase n=1 Tax=Clostridium cochlearium TaxID=1494 RepID=A0A240B1G5_CLOCO|nr:glucosamine-6-phosphate deaminase [Clostridium cochlearium]MBV1819118.1 glucosamine-6-phosphate deaminase [Bacteroidales bacterium MSK.15.36]NSJ91291.1 glucosamine-6-phosphate deaminase [Coprococcus sp. MSK.21.13]MBE6065116.1 glucosamine-6-phosphate deaminase [Clostridium cochlearium]MCG4572390.1 glucosamine-6-phosphate deaminase [Clostridium cochlearium]MDU1443784.1 glucosamine-6-phosphate deaminase [Clostridium cochlearium]
MKVLIKDNYNELSKAAALDILELVKEKPNCVLGLATGSTPVGTYEKLIEFYKEGKIDFSKVTSFNLDEYRGLPEDHPQSYKFFMNDVFFNHINIKKENTFLLNGMATNIEKECMEYDKKIDNKGGIDLQILGIGGNGHIAFNEPSEELILFTHLTKLKSKTIKDNSRFFNSQEEVPTEALTMGIGSIMKAKKIILLISGECKAEIAKKLIKGQLTTKLPASLLHLHPNCTVILDKEAAKFI